MCAPAATFEIGAANLADPFVALTDLAGSPRSIDPEGPPFQGGVVGLATYELGDRVEPLGLARRSGWADLTAARYEALLAFDPVRKRTLAIGQTRAQAEQAAAWLDERVTPSVNPAPLAASLEVDPPAAFEAAVTRIIERIVAGDLFQANIARRWRGRLARGARPFDLAQRLAAQSPAAFAAYLRLPGRAVVSNSPERFLSVRAGLAETRPIKGTRPRGANPTEDARLSEELIGSAKDRAENLMIVDLMRNDLARACAPGSVTVPALFELESAANVHHLVSAVRGALAAGQTAIDLFAAAFPPGSVTGAPKVQAMKTIAAHEPPRGVYCGSLFRLGFDGEFDSSVLIRTAAFEETADGWRFEARAGGGIVADSDPVLERLETEAKIAALLRALTEPA